MTDKKEFNKLCAEFLGWNYLKPYYYPLIKSSGIQDVPWDIDRMRFHSDWNWIMEVSTKIASLRSDDPFEGLNSRSFNFVHSMLHELLEKEIFLLKIKRFIEWYNLNKK